MVKKKESGELPNLAALKVAAARPFIVTNHKDRSEREYNTERKYKSKRGEKNKWRNDIETRRVNYVRTKFHLSIIYSVGWRSCISRELMERFRLVWQDRNSGRPAAFWFNRNRHPPWSSTLLHLAAPGSANDIWNHSWVSAVALFPLFSPFLFAHSFPLLLVKSSLASLTQCRLSLVGFLCFLHFGGDFLHVQRYYIP